jgi:hypothetical protein
MVFLVAVLLVFVVERAIQRIMPRRASGPPTVLQVSHS